MLYKNLGWVSGTPENGKKKAPIYAGLWLRTFAFTIDLTILYLINFMAFTFISKKILAGIFVVDLTGYINLIPEIPPELFPYIFPPETPPEAIKATIEILKGMVLNSTLSLAAMSVIGMIYYTILPATGMQATLGQWLFGAHMITKFGNRMNIFHSLFRYFSMLIFTFALPVTASFYLSKLLFPLIGIYFVIPAYIIALSGVWIMLFTKKRTMLHDIVSLSRVMKGKAGTYTSYDSGDVLS